MARCYCFGCAAPILLESSHEDKRHPSKLGSTKKKHRGQGPLLQTVAVYGRLSQQLHLRQAQQHQIHMLHRTRSKLGRIRDWLALPGKRHPTFLRMHQQQVDQGVAVMASLQYATPTDLGLKMLPMHRHAAINSAVSARCSQTRARSCLHPDGRTPVRARVRRHWRSGWQRPR